MTVLNDKKNQETAKIRDGKDYHGPDKGLLFNILLECSSVHHCRR